MMPTFCNISEDSMHLCTNSSLKKNNVVGRSTLNLPTQSKDFGKTHSSAGVFTYPISSTEATPLTTEEKIGVMLLNLGGPETLNDVQPFLYNLFADPVCFVIE